MATLAVAQPSLFPRKKRVVSQEASALLFLDSIQSVWKSHQSFAMWLVQKIHPNTVVDVGFDQGLSTLTFAYKNRGDVFGIDWFEEGGYAAKSFVLDAAFDNIAEALRLEYARNIHLIIGPFCDVSQKWKRKIDIFHIDRAYTYASVKKRYTDWQRYLKMDAVVLVHGVLEHPAGPGRFFHEQKMPKLILPGGYGLGVLSESAALIEEIHSRWV